MKSVYHIGHGGESVDRSQPRIESFASDSLAHRRARFDYLHVDARRSQFVREARKGVCALQVYDRGS